MIDNMTIKIFNHNTITQQPFFQKLIDFLDQQEDVTLRKIKAAFPEEPNLERQIEDFVQAGLISRENKRYRNQFIVFSDADFDLTLPAESPMVLQFNHPFFVASDAKLVSKLQNSQIQQTLSNQVNDITLHFSSDFDRSTDNLANYFYHMRQRTNLSPFEQEIFKLIGDVDPNYALKYMTTFLLKFIKKEVVKQKRPDIFVQTLEKYAYIVKVDAESYRFNLSFEGHELKQILFDNPRDFIAAQIRQVHSLPIFMTLGEK